MRTIVRILMLGRELWRSYLAIALAAVVQAATTLIVPVLISQATDVVVRAQGGQLADPVPQVVWLALALFGTAIVATLVSNVGGYLGDIMAVRLRAILSHRYFEHLLRLPQRYFDRELTGTIIGRLQRSITETSSFANSFANNFFPMLLTVGAALVVAATYSVWLAVLLIIIYPVFTWLTALTSHRWQGYEIDKNRDYDIANGRFAEVVGQIRVVKSYVQELRELRLFDARYDQAMSTTARQSRWWHLMDIARRGALDLVFLGIYLIVFIQTAQGVFSVASMVLLVQLISIARGPVTSMSFLVDSAQRAIAGSRDYLAALAETPESATLPSAPSQALAGETGAPALEFDHVSFGYDEGAPVVRDISFSVRPGERIAIVGESGGGKTTLTSLLLGLYRPSAGTIRLAGLDIASLDAARVRSHIGVVFQDASLFSGTVRENISYARPDAGDADIRDAAVRANAHDFITRFPNGYDSQIGERGLKLSGGQRQRIAIARAMLKNAPVLILDEATSSLDSRSERLVQDGLDDLMTRRTTIIIAHRLSTISSVDRIVTLVDGTIDEIGTPDELAATGGVYAELLTLQASASKRDRKRLRRFDIEG